MADNELTFAEQQSIIQQDYISSLPDRLQEIDQAWNVLNTTTEWADPLKQLHLHIHRIAGSAGTFGLPMLSEHARDIEKLIKPWMKEGCEPTEQKRMELNDRITVLRDSIKNDAPVKKLLK